MYVVWVGGHDLGEHWRNKKTKCRVGVPVGRDESRMLGAGQGVATLLPA